MLRHISKFWKLVHLDLEPGNISLPHLSKCLVLILEIAAICGSKCIHISVTNVFPSNFCNVFLNIAVAVCFDKPFEISFLCCYREHVLYLHFFWQWEHEYCIITTAIYSFILTSQQLSQPKILDLPLYPAWCRSNHKLYTIHIFIG